MFLKSPVLLVVTAAFSVALAGCSTADKNAAPPPKPVPVAAPAPPPPPVIVVQPPVFVVDDVNFEFDKSNLRPAATAILDRVAGELRAQPNVPYEVAGFTDSVGTAEYNQGLSERRAFAVHDYLIGRGVDDGQLSARGYGESNAIVSNSTREDRARNRRVEVRPQQ